MYQQPDLIELMRCQLEQYFDEHFHVLALPKHNSVAINSENYHFEVTERFIIHGDAPCDEASLSQRLSAALSHQPIIPNRGYRLTASSRDAHHVYVAEAQA